MLIGVGRQSQYDGVFIVLIKVTIIYCFKSPPMSLYNYQLFAFKFELFLLAISTGIYDVTIQTGSEKLAGTNANVFIRLYGQNGNSDLIKIASGKGNFQENRYGILF